MLKNITYFILLFYFANSAISQTDSLKKLFPKQSGKKQVQTIIDLAYALSTEDTKASKFYGKLAEEKAIKLGDSTMLATVWNDWSFTFMYAQELDSFLLLNQKAYHYRTLLKDSMGMAKSLSKIGNAYFEKGNYKKCLHANFKCLEYFKKLDTDDFNEQIYGNISAAFERLSSYEESLKYAILSEKIAIEHNNPYTAIRSGIGIGIAYANLNKVNEARFKYLSLIPQTKEYLMEEDLATIYQNLGVLESRCGNLSLGLEYYEKALTIYRNANDKVGLSLILTNLANRCMDANKPLLAEPYLNEALIISKELGSFYSLRQTYQLFSRFETLRGNYKESDKYLELFMMYTDSISNKSNLDAIAEMQVKYNTEQKELLLTKAEIKNKNFMIIILVSGLFILLLVIGIYLISQRRKLDRQKSELQTLQKLEDERSRIARDLHDNLGAELTLITSKIDFKSYKSVSDSERKDLDEIGVISRNANHLLRETIWSIHQSNITLEELSNKAGAYAGRIFEDSKVEVKMDYSNPDHVFSPPTALHLFRIIQESVNNSFKYSDASEVTLIITPHNLIIRDNGKGFDLQTVQKGYGLQNLTQRAKEINGDYNIDTQIGKGTTITISF